MKKLVLASLLASVALPAIAADQVYIDPTPQAAPLAAMYDWSGGYAGLFAGAGTTNVDVTDVDGYNVTGFSHSYTGSGFYGGGLAGYNVQRGKLVFGVEGELSYLDVGGSAQFPAYVGVRLPTDSLASLSTDFHAALTARLGVALDKVLIYGKGGVAGLNTTASFIDTDPTGLTLVSGTSATKFLAGYTVGGGVEIAVNPKWTVRGEYMFSDFGSISHTAVDSIAVSRTFVHDLSGVHTGKFVISYRW